LDKDADIALIGAPGRNNFLGAAYLFTAHANTWTQQQELTDPGGATFDSFGYSVALDNGGRTAFVGAPGENSAGAAYIFTEHDNTWTQEQELTASDAAANDGFGSSVVLANNRRTAIIGAPGKDAFKGAAYILIQSH
jgi:hypothetical protein